MSKKKSSKSSAENTIRNIRRNSRRNKYSGEEKIRIVLEGLRGEESVAELCWRSCHGRVCSAFSAIKSPRF